MASVKGNYSSGRVRLTRAPAWREEIDGKRIGRDERVDEALLSNRVTRKQACPFCNHEQHLPPIKVESDFMVIPGKAPANPGHALIIPLEHRESISELTDLEFQQMASVMQRISKVMHQARKPVFFGINWRPIGGQSVTHMHVHIQPTTSHGLPHLQEFPHARFFDPLSIQIVKKIQQRITQEGGVLAKKASFPKSRNGPVELKFRNATEFENSGRLLRDLYRITDEEYAKLLADPESVTSISTYGKMAGVKLKSDIKLLRGILPKRQRQLIAKAQEQGITLPEETLHELVRSSAVGASTKITINKTGSILVQFVPRATVVKPAEPVDILKGRRDTTPWGVSKVGTKGYWPIRETLDNPVLNEKDREKWNKASDKVLGLIRKALK